MKKDKNYTSLLYVIRVITMTYFVDADKNMEPRHSVKLPKLSSYKANTEAERRVLVSKYIARILSSPPDAVFDLLLPLDINGVYLSSGCFLLGIFNIEGFDDERCPCKTIDEIYDALIGLIDAELSERCICYIAEVDGQLVVIANFFRMRYDQVENPGFIERQFSITCRNSIEAALERLGVSMIACVSTLFEGVELLRDVYSILRETMAYQHFFAPLDINRSEVTEVRYNRIEAVSCLDRLGELITTIRENAYPEFTAAADALFSDIVKTPPYSMPYLFLRIQAFVHELGQELSAQRIATLTPDYRSDLVLGICSASNGAEMYAAFTEMLETVLADYNKLYAFASSSAVSAAREYISGNISNPALSPIMIADHLGVSRAALSSIFSVGMDVRLSEYIHRVRMDLAIDLMLSTDLTIAEISEKAGYGSVTTMHRAFQRFHNTSPARYRSYIRTTLSPPDEADNTGENLPRTH